MDLGSLRARISRTFTKMLLDSETIHRAATWDDEAPPASHDAPLSLLERAGVLTGRLLGPIVQSAAARRHTRVFHPVGVVVRADLRSIAADAELRPVAELLGSDALLRFSGALWKKRDVWPEVLGLAIRFSPRARHEDPGPDDQDLLFATIRSPLTMGFAPFTTLSTNYLSNHYFGVAPFQIDGAKGRFKLRVRTAAAPKRPSGEDRDERLLASVRTGEARLILEAKRHLAPQGWRPMVELSLRERVEVNQEALRFNPFLDGRGFRPRGFVHAIRRAAYPAGRIGSGAATVH